MLSAAEVSVVIRSLSDRASLLGVCISGLSDTSCAAEEFHYVVDLRPTESAFAVES